MRAQALQCLDPWEELGFVWIQCHQVSIQCHNLCFHLPRLKTIDILASTIVSIYQDATLGTKFEVGVVAPLSFRSLKGRQALGYPWIPANGRNGQAVAHQGHTSTGWCQHGMTLVAFLLLSQAGFLKIGCWMCPKCCGRHPAPVGIISTSISWVVVHPQHVSNLSPANPGFKVCPTPCTELRRRRSPPFIYPSF